MIARLLVGGLGVVILAAVVVAMIGPRRALAAAFAVPLYAVAIGAVLLLGWWAMT